MYENELQHYGVKGMKWGKRMAAKKESVLTGIARAEAGSVRGITNKRTDKILSRNEKIYSKNAKSAKKGSRRAKTYDRYAKAYDREIKVRKEVGSHKKGLQRNSAGKLTVVSPNVRRLASEKIVDGKNKNWESAVKDSKKEYRQAYARAALVYGGAMLVTAGVAYAKNRNTGGNLRLPEPGLPG